MNVGNWSCQRGFAALCFWWGFRIHSVFVQLCSMSKMFHDTQGVLHICFDQNHILFWHRAVVCVCLRCVFFFCLFFLQGKPHYFTTTVNPAHPRKMTQAQFLWPATPTFSGQVWAIKLTWLWSEKKLCSWFKESCVDCWHNHSLQCCSHTVLSLCPALFWLLVATH